MIVCVPFCGKNYLTDLSSFEMIGVFLQITSPGR
jgi:hypothetical protein